MLEVKWDDVSDLKHRVSRMIDYQTIVNREVQTHVIKGKIMLDSLNELSNLINTVILEDKNADK